MKKIVLLILAAAALCSCSKDEATITPVDGQYVARINEFNDLFCLVLSNGKCTYFAMFQNGKVFYYENSGISISGEYPNYTYRIEDFMIRSTFDSQDAFTAYLAGSLRSNINPTGGLGADVSIVSMEHKDVKFKLDNRTLDANGDGVLDEMQPDLFQ